MIVRGGNNFKIPHMNRDMHVRNDALVDSLDVSEVLIKESPRRSPLKPSRRADHRLQKLRRSNILPSSRETRRQKVGEVGFE